MPLKASYWRVLLFFMLIVGFRLDGLPFPRGDTKYSDSVTAHWTNAVFMHQSLQNGQFPDWRETTMAGQPFAANPLNKVAYPFQWLLAVLSPTLYLNISIVAHLLLAGLGMWALTGALGLRVEAQMLATLAYGLSPRLLGHMGGGHLDVLAALAWFPLLLWATRRLLDERNATRAVIQWVLIAGLLYIADVRVALFAFVTAGVYGLRLYGQARSSAFLRRDLWAALLVLPLLVGSVVPLLLWRPYMTRASLSLADAGVLAFSPLHLFGLVLPQHSPSVEQLTYFGLPVLLLALFGVWAFPRWQRWAVLVAVLFITLYAMGEAGAVWGALLNAIPALAWFRVPSRVWLVLALLVPLWAAYGLQAVLAHLEAGRSIPKGVNLGIMLFVFIGLFLGLAGIVMLGLPLTSGLSAIVMSVAIGVTLLAWQKGWLTVRRLVGLLMVLVAVDLTWTGFQLVEWRAEARWLAPSQALAERLVALQPARIYSPTYSLEQPVAAAYQLDIFGGVDPFQLTGVVRGVSEAGGVPITGYDPVVPSLLGSASDADVNQANRDAVLDTVKLAAWGVSHVVAAYPLDNPRLAQVDVVNGVYIYANQDFTTTDLSRIPNWPADEVNLPTADGVTRNLALTRAALGVSMLAFLIYAAIAVKVMREP